MPETIQNVPLQPLGWNGGNAILSAHIGNLDYLLRPQSAQQAYKNHHQFDSNEAFWRNLNRLQIFPDDTVLLKHFLILDWFPRAPGLYHTGNAEDARREAFDHLQIGFGDSPIRDRARVVGETRPNDYTVVFTPQGKFSMLEGGIGSIRLKPIAIEGIWHWLITATSDGIAHTGVPIAVPINHYRSLLPMIQQHGFVCTNIYGKINILADPFSRLFDRSERVQKMVLQVTDFDSCEALNLHPEVSVAVSFLSRYRRQDYPEVYATYVTFQPDIAGSFEDAISWMKNDYVEGEYQGSIITDFDQTQTIFREASLALSKVMDRLITQGALRESIELMHATAQVETYYQELERQALLPQKKTSERTHIFISYAHAPENQTGWVNRLRIHLQGLSNNANYEWWDDSKIVPGQNWHREIQAAISRSRVAILVLTADFLASEYITEAELPVLLEAADADGATILCVYGSQVYLSGVSKRLLKYQFVNSPAQPLQALSEAGRESVYAKIVQAVENAFTE
jgi:hypothetical protein